MKHRTSQPWAGVAIVELQSSAAAERGGQEDTGERKPLVYSGVHILTLACSLPTVMVSFNRLASRQSDFTVNRAAQRHPV